MPVSNAAVRCVTCNRNKGTHLYYARELKRKTNGPQCKSCYKKTPAYKRERDRYYKDRYGITEAEYQGMLAEQDGKCYVCQRKPGVRRLAVDHDHAIEERKGKRASVRGLLCRACNEYIGHIRDDAKAAYRLMDYLDRPTWRQR